MKAIGRKRIYAALVLSTLLPFVGLHRAEAGVNVWTTNGPLSALINALAIDPQAPTTLYAGGNGVFKSTDSGESWSAVTTGLTYPYARALVIDPQTTRTFWADGTRQLVFEPLTLLEKLAALTPRPRINLVLYHGVLAPHAGWGARVVAYGAPPVEAPVGGSAPVR